MTSTSDKKLFLEIYFADELNHNLKKRKLISSSSPAFKILNISETSEHISGCFEIGNNQEVDFYYNKKNDELGVFYVRPDGQGFSHGVITEELIKSLKPTFGMPAFSFESRDARNDIILTSNLIWPAKENFSNKLEQIKKKQIWSFVNYGYLEEEYKRKGEMPSESGL